MYTVTINKNFGYICECDCEEVAIYKTIEFFRMLEPNTLIKIIEVEKDFF